MDAMDFNKGLKGNERGCMMDRNLETQTKETGGVFFPGCVHLTKVLANSIRCKYF